MSEYEKILKSIGSFGPYQRRVFILVSMFETPAAWAMLLPIFLSRKVDWRCPESHKSLFTNATNTQLNYSLHPNLSVLNASSNNQCQTDGSVCPGIQFTEDFSSIISEWSLVCSREWIPSLITTIQMCGVLVGALIVGQLADLIGRRKSLYGTYSLLLIFSFISAFISSWQTFAVLRFIIGALVGGTMVVNFVLPLEFVTPQWRTFCGCVGFWAVGLMTLSLWAYFIRSWQYLVIGTSVSGIFILFSWWFVPESPRWLLTKGHFDEAEKLLKKIAKYNNKPLPDIAVLRTFAEEEQTLRKERSLYSYMDLFKRWKLAKNTLIVMYGWFVSSSVYYGLNFNTNNLTGNLYVNVFLSGLVEIPALIFVVAVNNKLGRRKTISCLMILAGISCFSVLFISLAGDSKSLSILTIVLAMIGKSGISGGWAATQVFSAETFPTVVRNIGVASCSMAARIGGIVAPQLVRLDNESTVLPFTVFGCLALVYGIVVLFLPETKGKPLPDDLQEKYYKSSHLNGHLESRALAEISLQNGNQEYRPVEEIPLQNG